MIAPLSFLLFLSFYLFTAPPTILSMDAGEFSGVAFYLGSAHAPGYPGYIILGKLFALLPLSSVAFRLNLLSCTAAAIAIPLLAKTLSILPPPAIHSRLKKLFQRGWQPACLAAAFLYGASATFWYEATIAEQYALHILSFIALLYAVLRFTLHEDYRYLLLAAFIGGFGIALHPLLLAYAGPFFFLLFLRSLKPFLSSFLLPTFFLFLAAYSVHLLLPLRSAANPPFDWGNPETFAQFLYLVTAEETRSAYPHIKQWLNLRSPILGNGMLELFFLFSPLVLGIGLQLQKARFTRYLSYTLYALFILTLYILIATPFLDISLNSFSKTIWLDILFYQYSYLFFPLILLGGFILFRSEKPLFFAFFYFFFMAFAYNISANFGHNNPILHDRHKMVAYVSLAFFLAAGLSPIFGFSLMLRQRLSKGNLLLLPLLLLLLFPFTYHFPRYNHRKATYMALYAKDILSSVNENAVLLVKGTQIVFPLWYLQFVERERLDVTVVLIDALSNPWYVHFFREHHPTTLRSTPPFPKGKKWALATLEERGVYLNKVAGKIIAANIKKRAIYYTAGPSDFMLDAFKKYKILPQGLVFRILPKKEKVNTARLTPIQDLLSRYRSVSSLRAFSAQDWIAKYYLTSFATIHAVLAKQALIAGDAEIAKDQLERSLHYAPTYLPALKELSLLIAKDDPDEGLSMLLKAKKLSPLDPQIWNNLGVLYEQKGKIKNAKAAYKHALKINPKYANAHYNLGILLIREKKRYAALKELEETLRLAPYDPEARLNLSRLLEEMKQTKKAEQVLIDGTKHKPSVHPLLYAALADFYTRQKQKKKAAFWRKQFEKARAAH